MSQKQVVTRPGGTVKNVRDATANDSDKIVLTVPTGKVVRVNVVTADFTTTATVGTRQLFLIIGNGTNNVVNCPPQGTQAASLQYNYQWSLTGQVYAIGGSLVMPLPDLLLPAGYTVRVFDAAGIDAAADDLITFIQYVEYEA